jgi:hypothetical protein
VLSPLEMVSTVDHRSLVAYATLMAIFVAGANAIDIFLEWNVALDNTIKPGLQDQPVRSQRSHLLTLS